jgi:hypothetical protein
MAVMSHELALCSIRKYKCKVITDPPVQAWKVSGGTDPVILKLRST